MKHLLNGVAIAAALAIVAPVWAQTSAPMTPSAPSAPRAPAAAAPAAPAPSASSAAARGALNTEIGKRSRHIVYRKGAEAPLSILRRAMLAIAARLDPRSLPL